MIAWAIETFIATTLLMLLVLALRKPVQAQFGPHIAYALWLLPVLRLLVPPLPGAWRFTDLIAPLTRPAQDASGFAADSLHTGQTPQAIIDQAVLQAQVELAGRHADLAAAPPVVTGGGANLMLVLIGLWALGALAFLAWHLIAHRRFCANLLARARVRRSVAEGRVQVIETDAATGPLAFGIWRKYVAFPRDFSERYDPVERNLALAHELGHHMRGDLIANWVALVVLALHWFNPVAWRAFRAFRADQELACDALVLSGRAPALRHAYGRAIVKSAHGGAVSAACHLHTVNELKGRLKMLSNHNPKSRARIAAGVTGAVALTLTGLALTASGSQAASSLRSDVGAALGVDLSQAEAPTPPAVPAVPAAPAGASVPDLPAPPAPPAALAADDAKHSSHVRVVMHRDKDGKIVVEESSSTNGRKPAIAFSDDGRRITIDGKLVDMPEVASGKCGPGSDHVVRSNRDGKQTITICTDRIDTIVARATASAEGAEAEARAARVVALRSADMGKHYALMSLKMARRSIEEQTSLSAEQKSAALKGIDDALREVQSDKD